MKGIFNFQVFHTIVACTSIIIVFILLYFPTSAKAWSGCNAYAIVILKSFDTDVVLQEQFYNAPNATPFSISREGYRMLDAPADFPRTRRKEEKEASVAESRNEESVNLVYPLDPWLATGVAYQGMKVSDAPLPYQGRFSGEWVVWTKEGPVHRTAKGDITEPLLLQCRLPLPQNCTEVQLQQRRYIVQHQTALSEALERWWHTAPAERASRCIYGDGEKTLTGAERYYELCPRGTITRVQHQRLKALLRGPEAELENGEKRKTASPTVLDFLRHMHESPSTRNEIIRNPRYIGVFEEVGRYHPRYSIPQWNSEYLVWESWYPSTRPCATHYTTISSFTTSPATEVNTTRAGRKIRPGDAYWKTVVRFRCPSQPSADEAQKLTTWSVTEVRQLCEYHVELMSTLVCGWEQELDSFNVNPIPCVVLD